MRAAWMLPMLLAAAALLVGSLAVAAGFDWDKWAAVANEAPCSWLDEAAAEKILGTAAVATPNVSRAASTCTWKAADGTLLLSASVSNFDKAANMVAEREEQLRNIGSGRFERIRTSGLTTAVLRKDRLYVTMFPNSDSEAAVLRLQGHPVLRETKEVRGQRERRLRAFAAAVIEKYEL